MSGDISQIQKLGHPVAASDRVGHRFPMDTETWAQIPAVGVDNEAYVGIQSHESTTDGVTMSSSWLFVWWVLDGVGVCSKLMIGLMKIATDDTAKTYGRCCVSIHNLATL